MESSISSPLLVFQGSKIASGRRNLTCSRRSLNLVGNGRIRARIPVVPEISTAADPAQAEITWQIVVGALAGVTPFVVAGIEFSKRIVAQKSCEVCGGSGLVLRDDYYMRCPGCGGFLPWQSWKRFFSG